MFILFIFIIFRNKGLLSNYVLSLGIFAQLMVTIQVLILDQWQFFFNYPSLLLIGYPFLLIQSPLIYFHVNSVAYKDFKIKFSHLLHIIPFIIFVTYLLITFYPYSSEEKIKIISNPSYPPALYFLQINIFARVQNVFYVIVAILVLFSIQKQLKESYSSISLMNLSMLRFIVIGNIVILLMATPVQIYYLFVNNNSILLLLIMLPSFIFFNILFFQAWFHPEIFAGIEESVKYKSSKLTKEEAQIYLNKLNEYIATDKPFINPDLSLKQLAEDLNINHRFLSQIINEYFNQNFFDYINRLRVEESKKMLCDPSCDKNVLQILLEVGFNSRSAYYTAFKRATGLTPTEYKKRNLKAPVAL